MLYLFQILFISFNLIGSIRKKRTLPDNEGYFHQLVETVTRYETTFFEDVFQTHVFVLKKNL